MFRRVGRRGWMTSGVHIADCSALEVANTRDRKMTVVVRAKFEERRARAVS